VERGHAIDRGARRKQVEQVLAGTERLALPIALEVAVHWAAPHHGAADAVLLSKAQDRAPVAAPARPNDGEPFAVLVFAGEQVVDRRGVYLLGADVDLDRRLASARHVEAKDADAVL